jgi:hypothetical protein
VLVKLVIPFVLDRNFVISVNNQEYVDKEQVEQKLDHKILHRKLKIEYHEPYYNQGITKYYTENYRLSTTNPTTTKGSQNTTQKTKD